MSTKRALVCSPRMPEYDRQSGERRIFNLIEFLRETGWAVSFVAQNVNHGEHYARVLQRLGVATYVGMDSMPEQLIAASRFDLAICAFWKVAESFVPIIRRASPATRIIIDSVDLHFLRSARQIFRKAESDPLSGLLDSNYASEMIRELNTYAAADGVFAVSQKEAELINDFIGDPTLARVVPDCEDLKPSSLSFTERKGILFIGNFWHRPNVEAAHYLCKEILPLLDPAILAEHPIYFVGNKLEETDLPRYAKKLPNLRMVGWVPSVLPYLEQARISVIPLLHGAGTKRKLIQALMIGTPTVSTSVGVEGLNLRHDEHVLVADSPRAFANSITRLLKDAKLWQRLARQGQTHITKVHSREAVRKGFTEVISSILNKANKAILLATESDSALPYHQTTRQQYEQLVSRIKEVVRASLPPDATLLVVSRGDDELLKLDGRRGWHFPQTEDGIYAGSYPADSDEAINRFEALRTKGCDYLLFPSTALWWLKHYSGFKQHLESHYRLVVSQEDTCLIFALRETVTEDQPALEFSSLPSILEPIAAPCAPSSSNGNGNLSREPQLDIASLDATLDTLGGYERIKGRRSKILVLGTYLANEENTIAHIVPRLSEAEKYKVEQRWIALGGEPPTKAVSDVTVEVLYERPHKFQKINELLSREDLTQYEYVLLVDDDVYLPNQFVDSFFSLQTALDFSLAQPARTSNSSIDHPIVEQQRGVLARKTLFVEIGPIVSFHKSVFDLMLPFDLTSPMGWGYENVWAYQIEQHQLKMGIIDAVPIDHSIRPVATSYSRGRAERGRTEYLNKHKEYLSLDRCFRVLDVVNFKEGSNGHAGNNAAY